MKEAAILGASYDYLYDEDFYDQEKRISKQAAEIILPYIFGLIAPDSVVDFGCGAGSWLQVAKKLGAERVLGIDGPWVDERKLARGIDFLARDLEEFIDLHEHFDLAISTEVAEHLSESRGGGFIDDLCNHADTVLFSAAIPGQGGVHHINEQYQSYWVKKFNERNFQCYDLIRPKFWDNRGLGVAYRQNCFLFASEGAASTHDRLTNCLIERFPPNLVHPKVLERVLRREPSLRENIKTLRRIPLQILAWLKKQ